MRQALKSLGLLFVLMLSQQGAMVHEIGHIAQSSRTEVQDLPGLADTLCALCPAYAQVVSPAFSHSFQLPLLARAAPGPTAEPLYRAHGAAVPTPRSRGPPSDI